MKTIKIIYKPVELDKGIYASCGSLKFDLRNMSKKDERYFSRTETCKICNIKNVGCMLYGQPDTWKGLFKMNIIKENPDHSCIVEIMIDPIREYIVSEEEKELMMDILQKTIDKLKKENIVRDAE